MGNIDGAILQPFDEEKQGPLTYRFSGDTRRQPRERPFHPEKNQQQHEAEKEKLSIRLAFMLNLQAFVQNHIF